MGRFREQLAEQRWDDHRYYHHSIVNQALHFFSACTFVLSYALVWNYPWLAALLAWGFAMTSRQAGHFFFEPKGYDYENEATHEYKEEIKVGYNLARKVVLMGLWGLAPLVLYLNPSFFGVFSEPFTGLRMYLEDLGMIWLALGVGALLFRTIQLFFIRDVETGLVWAAKIITDPFHDMKMYFRAPGECARAAKAWRPARRG